MGNKLTKLNIGCGKNIMKGWTNIDAQYLPGVDIVCNFEYEEIDLPDNSVEYFLLSHVLEHVNDSLGLMEELFLCILTNIKWILSVNWYQLNWRRLCHLSQRKTILKYDLTNIE